MKKVIGWTLFLIGVLVIIWGIWSSFEIFTAKKPPYEIFKTPEAEEVSLKQEKAGLEGQMQEQMQQVIKEQFEKMLPSDFLPKLFNLIAWSIFMGILVFGAGKLSSLGIKLL
ncbi:hypothetical protein J7K42_01985 [bacterium]|nr:hypothetical protein [bacterium]